MNPMDEVRYEAFFDELGCIEKRAMLEKAALNPTLRAIGQFARRPWQTTKSLGRIARHGYKEGVGEGVRGVGSGVAGAAKRLWKAPAGKVALVGGGALAAGALGTGGLGYMHGRSSAAPRYQ